MNKALDRLTLPAFAVIVLIGGINFVAVRFSNQELPPFWGAGTRFAIASLLLFFIVLLKKLPMPKGRALIGVIIYGVLNFAGAYAFAYFGLLKVQAGLASVVIALVPLLTFFLALVQKLESFRWQGLAGGLLAVLGIALVFREQLNLAVPLLFLLSMAAAAFCIAETNVVLKIFPKHHPIVTNALAMAIGSLILLVISHFSGEAWVIPTQASTWIAFLYLIFIGSIVLFMLYLFTISRWTASRVSYQFVLTPLVTIPVAAVLVSETVSFLFLAGALLVSIGVYVGAFLKLRFKSH